jgi:hypothetical protein
MRRRTLALAGFALIAGAIAMGNRRTDYPPVAAADVLWYEDTLPYQSRILDQLARVRAEDCPKLDLSSVAKSPTRGTDARPVFFVTCLSSQPPKNIWFDLDWY